MSDNSFYSLALGFCFFVLFAYTEVLHRFFDVTAQSTSRIAHFMTGVIVLFFPFLLNSHWYVLLLCLMLFFIELINFKIKFLLSIDEIHKPKWGGIGYPITIYTCFCISDFLDKYIFFCLPVLLLAVCSPMAALIGEKCRVGKYQIFKEEKTWIRSAAFLLCAFIVCIILFNGFTGMNKQAVFFMSVIVSVATCLTEAISQKGYDNLLIPFVALITLITANYLLLY